MQYAQNMKTMNSVTRQVYMRNHIGSLDTFPEEIILLPTMRCNYNCVTCSQNHADEREYPASFIEELKGILPFAKFVNITGGEPLLYKHFDELISVISQGQCDYWLVTNASLLTERWRAKLLDSPLRTIKFSIDGGTPQAYSRIRTVGNFFKVLKNIAEFMELATPTGLAVVKTLAEDYGPLPLGSVLAVGYGSGTYSTGAYPTFLRAFLVEEGQRRARCGDSQERLGAVDPGEPIGPTRGRGDVFGPHGHPYYGPNAHMTNGKRFTED